MNKHRCLTCVRLVLYIFACSHFFSRLDHDHQLDVPELESIVRALYELSDADMARIEPYDDAIDRIKLLFLTNHEDTEADDLLDSVTKSEFVDIVQKDASIMKLIDCRPILTKRGHKSEHLAGQSFKKQLKFKPPMYKSLSDSTLTKPARND
jgi:hypothetical protein